jgi:hypothetical protein
VKYWRQWRYDATPNSVHKETLMKSVLIFTLTLLAALPALAQNDTSWVSRSGLDTNPCTISQPCRTFQTAYGMTNNNGVIKAMDAGEYGPIGIGKPIIIDGNGVGASIDAGAVPFFTGVSVTSTGPVEIRSLAIHFAICAVHPCKGIGTFNSNVSIEDVSITGIPDYAVYVDGGTATIHDLTVTGAQFFGIYIQDSTATISDSLVRYSATGIFVQGVTAVAQALIERSRTVSNTTGLLVQNAGFAATARISDNVISANATGTSTSGGGQIITLRNNTWAGNSTDGSTPFSISLK